jgi:sugar (pentulose or hexulose) kinase
VLGVPFVVPTESDYSCWGAALAAGTGVGMIDDLAERAQATLRVREVVQPDAAVTDVYRAMVKLYEVCTPRSRNVPSDLAQAAGA